MKGLTVEFQSHLDQSPTTCVMCWKITPKPPGLVVGFTEHVNDLLIEELNYSAQSGFSPSALKNSSDLSVDNFDVTFLLEFDGTAEAQLIAGYYDYAQVEVFLVNYADLSMGKIVLARGMLGEITVTRDQAQVEVRGLSQALQQDVLEVTSPTCRANLGDARCNVNLADFTRTGVVTGVTNNQQFSDENRTEADAYFNGGLLTFTSGDNALLRMEVKSFTAETHAFELHHAMPYPIKPGDTYEVYRGCDKAIPMCRDVFSNVANFRGEPYLPGIDQVVQFGGRS